MDVEKLTPEQRKLYESCASPAEMLELAKGEGYELSDEELDEISGGGWNSVEGPKCPNCASTNIEPQGMHTYKCLDCNQRFTLSQ